jgi:hypothetical protein
MANPAIQRLGLKMDPFLPDEIDPKKFEKALDPHDDPRLLNYYFDVYHWSDSGLVGELDPPVGLRNFPSPDEMNQPLLLIVSGTEDTGRRSLVNLLRHEIKALSPNAYEVESFLGSRDAVAHVENIALSFISSWEQTKKPHTREELSAQYSLFTAKTSVGNGAHYPNLFARFRQATDTCGIDPVVVIVRKGDHYDVWASIYQSLAPLAKYVIVETTKPDHARTCYEQISKEGGSVALMDARRLDLSSARRYVAARLKAERAQASDDELWPFSDKSLAVLFKPGVQPQDGGVRWPIGSLRGMLRATFESHVSWMTSQAKPPQELSDHECRITEATATQASSRWQGSKDKRKKK